MTLSKDLAEKFTEIVERMNLAAGWQKRIAPPVVKGWTDELSTLLDQHAIAEPQVQPTRFTEQANPQDVSLSEQICDECGGTFMFLHCQEGDCSNQEPNYCPLCGRYSITARMSGKIVLPVAHAAEQPKLTAERIIEIFGELWPRQAQPPSAAFIREFGDRLERTLLAASVAPRRDLFDFMGEKVMTAIVETGHALERLSEPFRSGGITALEEFYFRLSGKHFDWEEVSMQPALAPGKQPPRGLAGIIEGLREEERIDPDGAPKVADMLQAMADAAPPVQERESDERRVEIWFDESPTQGSNRGFLRFRDKETKP